MISLPQSQYISNDNSIYDPIHTCSSRFLERRMNNETYCTPHTLFPRTSRYYPNDFILKKDTHPNNFTQCTTNYCSCEHQLKQRKLENGQIYNRKAFINNYHSHKNPEFIENNMIKNNLSKYRKLHQHQAQYNIVHQNISYDRVNNTLIHRRYFTLPKNAMLGQENRSIPHTQSMFSKKRYLMFGQRKFMIRYNEQGNFQSQIMNNQLDSFRRNPYYFLPNRSVRMNQPLSIFERRVFDKKQNTSSKLDSLIRVARKEYLSL